MFSLQQPVDMRTRSIRQNVRHNIPAALDTILFLHGNGQTEYATNGADGSVPLFPALTEKKLESNPDASREFQRYESVLLGLTSHKYFPVSHVRIHENAGAISEFSVVFVKQTAKSTESYELYGALSSSEGTQDSVNDEFYLIENTEDGTQQQPLKLDRQLTSDIISAACILHGQGDTPLLLNEKLLYLLDASNSKTIRQSGEYSILGGEALLQADRSEFVTRKLGKSAAKLTGYRVRIQRGLSSQGDAVGVTSVLDLNFDSSDRPMYSAFYDMAVNDPHRTMEKSARTSLFEERFMFYRSQPETFFNEIAESLDGAASLND